MSIKHPSRLRLVLLGSTLAVALAAPTVARADTTPGPTILQAFSNGATISLHGGTITGRVLATTSVDFTCEPFVVFDWETGTEVEVTTGSLEFGSVTLIQVSGRTINSGSADFWGGSVTCDGSTVNHRDVGVIAGILPWKSGGALGGATISISSPDFQTSDGASSGPITLRLAK